jgi:DNA invertase Pin-like site-specific DNA recombinase
VPSYRLGYARVSTWEQDPGAQLDALAAAGVDQVFLDRASGALTERPELAKLLGQIRRGTRWSSGA